MATFGAGVGGNLVRERRWTSRRWRRWALRRAAREFVGRWPSAPAAPGACWRCWPDDTRPRSTGSLGPFGLCLRRHLQHLSRGWSRTAWRPGCRRIVRAAGGSSRPGARRRDASVWNGPLTLDDLKKPRSPSSPPGSPPRHSASPIACAPPVTPSAKCRPAGRAVGNHEPKSVTGFTVHHRLCTLTRRGTGIDRLLGVIHRRDWPDEEWPR